MASVAAATKTLEHYLASGEEGALRTLFISLPDGLPPELLRGVFERFLTKGHAVSVAGRRLNPHYVDLFLEVLEGKPLWPESVAARSLAANSPEVRAAQLSEVLRKVGQLGIFSMSRSQSEARVREFAKDPALVEAARALVRSPFAEGRAFHRFAFLSVLAEDASEESIDALLPFVHEALKKRDESLDVLRGVVRWRKKPKPALTPLIHLLEETAQSRAGVAQREPFARTLGLKTVPKKLSFRWWAQAAAKVKGVAWGAGLKVDCDAEPWFTVQLNHLDVRPRCSTRFQSNGAEELNELALPRLASLEAFPAWFADVSRTLQIRWTRSGLLGASLRGSGRSALEVWLRLR